MPEQMTVDAPRSHDEAGSTSGAVPDAPRHAEGMIQPDPPRTEAERIDPQPVGPVVLRSGTQIDITPMNIRETMKLLRIITHGAGGYLGQLMDGLNLEDPGAFATTLATVVVMSFPDAEYETIEFLRSMCEPAGIKDEPDEAVRKAKIQALHDELDNPNLGDFTAIVVAIIKRESEDIRALGKHLSAALNLTAQLENVNSSQKKD
jgi:hypothetical protein